MRSRNVVFMMLDTARADVFGAYGGGARTPNFDRLARNGTMYDMAIAPGTCTLSSHLSLFVGRRPRSIQRLRTTGLRFSDMNTDPFMRKSRHRQRDVMMAEVMEYFGYRSALFSNNPFVSEPTGLAAGFSYVSNIFIDRKLRSGSLSVKAILRLIESDASRKSLIRLACAISSFMPRDRLDSVYMSLRKRLNRDFSREYGYYELDKGAGEANCQLRRYLGREAEGSNFIFMNYMEAHEGYPTNLVTDRYVEQDKWLHMIGEASECDLRAMVEAYRKRIEYLDTKIGEAVSVMRKAGALDDATLIVASDHGQAFMEHGSMFHNVYPHNEVARVPLAIAEFRSGRQVRSARLVDEPFSLTELNGMVAGRQPAEKKVPVVNDHMGIVEVWDSYLLGLIRRRSRNADRIYRKKREQDRHATAVYHSGYKLMHYYGRRKDELYRLSDKAEEDNLIDGNRGLAHTMLALGSRVA